MKTADKIKGAKPRQAAPFLNSDFARVKPSREGVGTPPA